jgi:flavonoid 3'-monooxygenase
MGTLPHQSLVAMARTYGLVMHLRLGLVDMVLAASASVATQVLKSHDLIFLSRPPNANAKYIAYNYQDLVFPPYGLHGGACLGRSAPFISFLWQG